MPNTAAFVTVVLIWATTPLTINWSGREVGFLFGLTARMVIGLSVLLLLHALFRRSLPRDFAAIRVYIAGGLGIFIAMTCVYWAALYIPSGWISVIFGLTPLVTSIMAAVWLNEKAFSGLKWLGKLLGLSGLGILFLNHEHHEAPALFGIALVLTSVITHSASAVWVKKFNQGLDGFSVTTGSMLVATPLYLLSWLIADGHWPDVIPARAAYSIVYLALFGSVIGFVLYYYLLRHLPAYRVALITLLTPVIALWLGHWLNDETITRITVIGTATILLGLGLHEWGDKLLPRLVRSGPK